MLEYLGHPISSLSSNGSAYFLAGVANYLAKNCLQLWTCDPSCGRLDSKAVLGEITSTCMARTDLAAAATSDGCFTIFLIKDNCLNEVHTGKLNDDSISCIDYNNSLGLLIMASESGEMSIISPGQLGGGVKSHRVSKLPLTSVDASSANEVIFGTTAGHLKVMDLRTDKADVKTLSMSSASPITKVTRNPASPQFVVCGNESGTMCLWDMRNINEAVLQVSSHESPITGLLYDVSQVNSLFSSSLDGQLLRWEFDKNHMKTVEPLVRPMNLSGPSISCFCLGAKSNGKTQLIYGTDREVLHSLQL